MTRCCLHCLVILGFQSWLLCRCAGSDRRTKVNFVVGAAQVTAAGVVLNSLDFRNFAVQIADVGGSALLPSTPLSCYY